MAYGKKTASKKKDFTPCPACKNAMACKKMGRCMKGMK